MTRQEAIELLRNSGSKCRAEVCLAVAKQSLTYISENTLDKWSRLKANEALDRIREIENA